MANCQVENWSHLFNKLFVGAREKKPLSAKTIWLKQKHPRFDRQAQPFLALHLPISSRGSRPRTPNIPSYRLLAVSAAASPSYFESPIYFTPRQAWTRLHYCLPYRAGARAHIHHRLEPRIDFTLGSFLYSGLRSVRCGARTDLCTVRAFSLLSVELFLALWEVK